MKQFRNMIWLIKMFKYFPAISNAYVLLSVTLLINNIHIDNYVFDIFGSSIYIAILCLIASYVFKFCTWYRVLCISSLISLTLEWIDINIVKINYYLYIVQMVVISGILISIIVYLYGKRIEKRNNTVIKETN